MILPPGMSSTQLAKKVDGFILVGQADSDLIDLIRHHDRKVFLHLTDQTWDAVGNHEPADSIDGYVVEGLSESTSDTVRIGKRFPGGKHYLWSKKFGQKLVKRQRSSQPEASTNRVMVLQLLQSGADLVLVDSGMVFSGPRLTQTHQ